MTLVKDYSNKPQRKPLRDFLPGMRLAVRLPDDRLVEIPEAHIQTVLIGGCVPDVTPMTAYPVVVL